MNVKSIRCRVVVYDCRCICGQNTRYEYFDSVAESYLWVSSLKNRVYDWFQVCISNDNTWKTYPII